MSNDNGWTIVQFSKFFGDPTFVLFVAAALKRHMPRPPIRASREWSERAWGLHLNRGAR